MEYVHQSGRITTPASRASVIKTIRTLAKAVPAKRVNEVTEQDLVTWIFQAAAPNSQRRRKTVCSSMFRWAHWKGYVAVNPATHLEFSAPVRGGGVREHTWLSEEEIAKVVATCDDSFTGRRNRCILLFGFLTGLRLIELTRLTWDSVSRDGSSVLVMRKNRKLTPVGLPTRLQHELSTWRIAVSQSPSPASGGPLFPRTHSQWDSWDGDRGVTVLWDQPLGDQGIANVVRNAGKAAGFEGLCPHDMRRSYAALLETKGFSIVDISRMLAHANTAVTQRYLDNSPGRTAALASGLEVDL